MSITIKPKQVIFLSVGLMFELILFCLPLYAVTSKASNNFLKYQYIYILWLIPISLLSVLIYVLIKRFMPSKSELFVREIFTHSAYAITVLNSDSSVKYLNDKAKEIFLVDENISLPAPLSKLFAYEKKHKFLKSVTDIINIELENNNTPFIFQAGLPTRDGSGELLYLMSIRAYYSTMYNKNMYLLAAIETNPDQISSESLQKALFEAERNLEKLKNVDKLKSEFLATCSHELKTPLASMMGYLNLMYSEKLGEINEKQSKALKVSLRNIGQLDTLISSMLNLARMEAGKLDFYFTSIDLNILISEAVDAMKPIADKKKIEIKYTRSESKSMILADYGLIYSVFLNTIGNSIKFSPEKTLISISIEHNCNNTFKVIIADQGYGIPEPKIKEIKMPFVQIDRKDTYARKGLGLGLAICEKILVGHGTTLTIESEENRGTKVSFALQKFEKQNKENFQIETKTN